jgi:hypothetical protein
MSPERTISFAAVMRTLIYIFPNSLLPNLRRATIYAAQVNTEKTSGQGNRHEP